MFTQVPRGPVDGIRWRIAPSAEGEKARRIDSLSTPNRFTSIGIKIAARNGRPEHSALYFSFHGKRNEVQRGRIGATVTAAPLN